MDDKNIKDLIDISKDLDDAVLKGIERGKKYKKAEKSKSSNKFMKKVLIAAGLTGIITTGIGIVNPEFVSAIPGLREIIRDINKDRFSEDTKKYADRTKVIGSSVVDKEVSVTFEELVYDENNIIGSFTLQGEKLKQLKEGVSNVEAYVLINGENIITESCVEMENSTTAVVILKADIGRKKLSDNANIKFDITGIYNGYSNGIEGRWEFATNADKTKGNRVLVDKNIETKFGNLVIKELSMTDVSTTIVIDGKSKVPDDENLQSMKFVIKDDKGKVYDVKDLENGQFTKTGELERVISVNGDLTKSKYIKISEKVGGKIVDKEIEGIYHSYLQFNGDGAFETKVITRKATREELNAGYGGENVNIYASISNDFKKLLNIKGQKIEVSKGQEIEVVNIKDNDLGTEFIFKTDGLYDINNLTQLQVLDENIFDYQRGEDRISILKTVDKNSHIYSVTINKLDFNKKYIIGIPKVTPIEKSSFELKIDLNE
ncbi:MAG: DUF4179 domain-containing protein [Sarcina sp.]